MPKLEQLLTHEDRARLEKQVDARVACRSFASPLSLEDWSALSYVIGRWSLPGARLVLKRVDQSLFGDPSIPAQMSGCTAIAAVIVDQFERFSRANAGIAGEALCLEATALGLGSCWLTGSYRRRMLNLPMKGGESLLGVIALGHPAPGRNAVHHRKPLNLICRSDPAQWDGQARRAALLVQLAPSAMNAQPWLMDYAPHCLTLDVKERSQPELGIAMLHAELALQTPHTWRMAERPGDPAAQAVWEA